MGQTLNINRVKRTDFGGNISIFLLENYGSEREKGRVEDFFRRSSEFRQLKFTRPRTKVHRFDEGYTCIPKRRDFAEDPKEEIWGKSKFSSLEGVLETSYHSTTLQDVVILHTLVYFHPLGCFKGGCLY